MKTQTKIYLVDKDKVKGYPNKSGIPPFPEGVIDVCWNEARMGVYLTFKDNSVQFYPPSKP